MLKTIWCILEPFLFSINLPAIVLTFRGEGSIKEHKDILDLALNKDFIKAQKILEEHIQNGIDHAMKIF